MSVERDALKKELENSRRNLEQIKSAKAAFNKYKTAATSLAMYVNPTFRENFEIANKEFIQFLDGLSRDKIIDDIKVSSWHIGINRAVLARIKGKSDAFDANTIISPRNKKFESFFAKLEEGTLKLINDTEQKIKHEESRYMKLSSEESLKEVSKSIKLFKDYSQSSKLTPLVVKNEAVSLNNLLKENGITDFTSELDKLVKCCEDKNVSEIEKILEGQRDKTTGKYSGGLIKKLEKFVVDIQKQREIILKEAQVTIEPEKPQIVQQKDQSPKKSQEEVSVLLPVNGSKAIAVEFITSLNKLKEPQPSKNVFLNMFSRGMTAKERDEIDKFIKDINDIKPNSKNYESDLNDVILEHRAQNSIHKTWSSATEKLVTDTYEKLNPQDKLKYK